MLSFLLRRAALIVCYARAQIPIVTSTFGVEPRKLAFIPLGVDIDFFSREVDAVTVADTPEVLSVGTNEGKDFATLLEALPAGSDCLIVTDDANARLVSTLPTAGVVRVRTSVPIAELRQLYRSAKRVVIPLREANYSSGQTVLLENLACGRKVIVSGVSGVSDYFTEGTVVVAPMDVAALRNALISPATIGHANPAELTQHLSVKGFATRLLEAIAPCIAPTISGGKRA